MYDEFPQEYAKLKVALEEEEFEKAEAVLLMILQKNPNLPEAKLHLEKVRAKVGSISNYEFRVRAFLDQKDYATAEQIIKEAKSKFTYNQNIKDLISYYNERVSKIKDQKTSSSMGKTDLPDLGDLPNLDTISDFPADAQDQLQKAAREGLKRSTEDAPWAKTDFGGFGTEQGAESEPPIPSFQPIIPDAGPAMQGKTSIDESAEISPPASDDEFMVEGEVPQWHRGKKTETYSKDKFAYKPAFSFKSKAVGLDNPNVGRGIMVLIAALILLPLIALLMYMYQNAKLNIDEPLQNYQEIIRGIDLQDIRAKLNAFPFRSEKEQDKIIDDILKRKFVKDDKQKKEKLQIIEACHKALLDLHLTPGQKEKITKWLLKARLENNKLVSIKSADFNVGDWNPDEEKFGVAMLQSNTTSIVTIGALLGLLPGILLGLVLARCNLPFLNRIFSTFWELWYAIPSIAILFIGVWYFQKHFINAPVPDGFIGLMMGLFIAPHIAFVIQQGFRNIVDKPLIVEIGLGALVILSGLAIGIARLIGEAVLTLGLLSFAEPASAQWAQSIQTFANPIFETLTTLKIGTFDIDIDHIYNQSISLYIAFQIFMYSLIISAVAQGLQIIVAFFGLKGADETPQAHVSFSRFKTFSKKNIFFAVLGFIVIAAGLLVFIGAFNNAGELNQPASWSGLITYEKVNNAVGETWRLALFAGIAALVIGVIPVLIISALVKKKFHRAAIESFLRIPIGISPVVFVVLAVEYWRKTGDAPDLLHALITCVIIAAPLAWCLIYMRWERLKREPFIAGETTGQTSHRGFIILAKLLDLVAIGFFLMAFTAGLLEAVIATGSSVNIDASGGGLSEQFTSLIHQFYWLMGSSFGTESYKSPETFEVFKTFMFLLLKLIAIGFVFKILSELSAQAAKSKLPKMT